MKTPHKHAELIKAWADGAEIEKREIWGRKSWKSFDNIWTDDDYEYRIKSDPKPDVVQFYRIEVEANDYAVGTNQVARDNLKLTFDGETGKLKAAEVIA